MLLIYELEKYFTSIRNASYNYDLVDAIIYRFNNKMDDYVKKYNIDDKNVLLYIGKVNGNFKGRYLFDKNIISVNTFDDYIRTVLDGYTDDGNNKMLCYVFDLKN
jgi:hypothetical protein